MNVKQNLSNMAKNAKVGMIKHGPGICTGIGIVCLIGAGVAAVMSTPKALDKIEDEKIRKENEQIQAGVPEEEVDTELTKVEIVKTVWKDYIPALGMGVIGTGLIIGASSANVRRNAALATAYKLSEAALSEYKDAVLETVGEKKEVEIREKVAEKKLEKHPVDEANIIVTGTGTALCFEGLSGRYFKADMQAIRRAENQLNADMNAYGYASLSTLYRYLKLETTDFSDRMGWDINSTGLVELRCSAKLVKDETPCIVIDYSDMPDYGFDSCS